MAPLVGNTELFLRRLFQKPEAVARSVAEDAATKHMAGLFEGAGRVDEGGKFVKLTPAQAVAAPADHLHYVAEDGSIRRVFNSRREATAAYENALAELEAHRAEVLAATREQLQGSFLLRHPLPVLGAGAAAAGGLGWAALQEREAPAAPPAPVAYLADSARASLDWVEERARDLAALPGPRSGSSSPE